MLIKKFKATDSIFLSFISFSGENHIYGLTYAGFAYSAAQESIVELKSKEEYDSCDVTNPIRMYTDGIDGIPLVAEGTRYFASSRAESCKGGLRLPVVVQPREKQRPIPVVQIATSEDDGLAAAAGPTVPSGSHRLSGASSWLASSLVFGIGLCYLVL